MTDRAVRELDPEEVAELHRQRDEIIARIDEEKLLPGWAWPQMMDTLTELADLPDDLAWLPVRYLQAVTIRREAMFSSAVAQQELDGTADLVPPYRLRCSCGGATDGTRETKRSGRWIRIGRCTSCGVDLVEFDGEPYRMATLIAQGLGRDVYGTPQTPV